MQFRRTTLATLIAALAVTAQADTTYHLLANGNFRQDWTNTALISADNSWANIPSIMGYADALTGTGVDAKTILVAQSVVNLKANQTTPNTNTAGGLAEFELTDPVVAFQGSSKAPAPALVIHLDTTNSKNISVSYRLRDIDGSADNSAQTVALQYRVGETGDFKNIDAGYVADASTGPSAATNEVKVAVTLPADAENQAKVQLRIQTANASGNDEWIGIDDIEISATKDGGNSGGGTGGGSGSPDTQAPVLSAVKVASVTESSASLSLSSDEAGSAWFVVLPAAAAAPSADQIVAGNAADDKAAAIKGNGAVTAGTVSFAFSGLTAATDYKLYVLAADATGNRTNVSSIDFSSAAASSVTRIHDIQGKTDVSPLNGKAVTVEAIVTAVHENGDGSLNGFFIQEADADADSDPLTSEGIFVYTASKTATVAVGDRVRVAGTVTENFNNTQIKTPVTTVLAKGVALPKPAEVALPVQSQADYERFEGMLVRFAQQLTVTDNYGLGRYGEVGLSVGGRLLQPSDVIDINDANPDGTSFTGKSNVAALNALIDENARRKIVLDDGFTKQNPDPIAHIDPVTKTLRLGSTVDNLVGVMDYRFNIYRIQPAGPIKFNYSARPAAPKFAEANLKIGSANVLNFFKTTVSTDKNSRGANNAAEFDRQLAKTVAELSQLDADVLGILEMENIDQTAIDLLVASLNKVMGAGTYAKVVDAIKPFSQGSDAIKVAMIYKPAVVEPVGASQIYEDAIFDRPSLGQVFRHKASGEEFAAIMNHFKSKRCDGAGGADADQQDGQGCFNDRRRQQATKLLDFVNKIKPANGRVMLLGDFNAYTQEDPLDVIRTGGFSSVKTPSESYQFNGYTGSLDHALATAPMSKLIVGAAHWNINADEPTFVDYNLEFKSATQQLDIAQGGLYSATPYRSSDHDPVIVGLKFGAGSGNGSGNGSGSGNGNGTGTGTTLPPVTVPGGVTFPRTGAIGEVFAGTPTNIGVSSNGVVVVGAGASGKVDFVGSTPAGTLISIAKGGKLSLTDGRSFSPVGADALLRTRPVEVNGKTVQVLDLVQGRTAAAASDAGVGLLALPGATVLQSGSKGGEADMQTTADGSRIVAVTNGSAAVVMTSGKVELFAGERTTVNASGSVGALTLGSIDGKSGVAGDPLSLPAITGMKIEANVAKVDAAVARAGGKSLTSIISSVSGLQVNSQRADGVLRLVDRGVTYNALPLGPVTIEPGRADGMTTDSKGDVYISKNGVVVRLVPALADPAGWMAALRKTDPAAEVTLRADGLLQVKVNGRTMVVRPGWRTTSLRAMSASNGRLFDYATSNGEHQTLHAAFHDVASLGKELKKIDQNATITTEEDGSVSTRLGERNYRLSPYPTLDSVPADAGSQAWWVNADGLIVLRNSDATSQTFTAE